MNTTISEPVDMAGLGYQQRLGSYRCHAGNVPWPETLVLIGADGELLASQDLSDISRTGYADVESMTVQGDKVQVTWVASEMPGANFEPVTYRMVFAYSAGKLTHTGASAPKPSSGGGGRSQVKDVSALDSVEFASPTGRIQCYMGDDSVDCSPPAELLNSGKVPSDAEVCPGLDVEVGAVSVGRQGTGAWQCAGGVTALPMPGQASTSWADDGYGTRSNDGQYVALPYGKSLKRGGFTCSSAQDGVTCKNSSGGGFTVNRSAATFF